MKLSVGAFIRGGYLVTVEQNACDLWQAKAMLKDWANKAAAYEVLIRLAAEARCPTVRAHAEDVLADCGIPVFRGLPDVVTTVDTGRNDVL